MSVQTFFKRPAERLSEREKQREKAACHERARNLCQRCGIKRSVEAHHCLLRKHGGSDRSRNLIALCEPCHDEVHDAPADAYREGFMCREFPAPGDFWFERAVDASLISPWNNQP